MVQLELWIAAAGEWRPWGALTLKYLAFVLRRRAPADGYGRCDQGPRSSADVANQPHVAHLTRLIRSILVAYPTLQPPQDHLALIRAWTKIRDVE